ncbi:MAG: T9SS type A sorting domain-containing protein [Bacteroidota bacterium]
MRYLLFIPLIFCMQITSAQLKYDYQWVLGHDKGAILDFNTSPVSIDSVSADIDVDGASASMSNPQGELQFYSNRCFVADAKHQLMENGDSISLDLNILSFCKDDGQSGSNTGVQSIIALPIPEHPDEYYLFYYGLDFLFIDTFATITARILYCAHVDMRLNNGKGAVIKKNISLFEDAFAPGYLQAVQHANGRDWWILFPQYDTNCYFRFLLTPDDIIGPFKQCLGNDWNRSDWSGQAAFSPDGTKYARCNSFNFLHLYDFDRCKGELSNYTYSEPTLNMNMQGRGVAFSPNSRYLYITASREVYQYDTEAADIDASKILIAEYDGFENPFPVVYGMSQLAPDNKIYIAGGSSIRNLSTINQPDSAGLACEFVPHSIDLPSFNFRGLPNFPHFRMGPSEETCDTLFTSTENLPIPKHPVIEIFPNPAHSQITIRMEHIQAAELFLYDALGKPVQQHSIQSTEESLLLETLPPGLYFCDFLMEDGNRVVKKLIIK